MSDDRRIHDRINDLVREEHDLRARLADGQISPQDEQSRLRAVEVELDQAWDLLRQRDARRAAGQDPDDARRRDPSVVESYEG